jgi:hypothetical protein
MLQPQDRRLLMESLRPPPGFQLDYAVGTTFSLDLVALLVTPLAFTFFDWEAEDGKPVMEPIALLKAIRKNADRLAVFCQAGEIKVPPREQRLFAYLEDCVHQVTAYDSNGVFHPKVWVLRFIGEERDVIYRMICASRNITFDRSWDTLLVLDGKLRERQNGFARNHPLGDFIRHLPQLTTEPLPEPTKARIDQIEQEIRRVEFEPPENMELVAFWPIGIPNYRRWPFQDCRDRFLVISPFLSPDTLNRLRPTDGSGVLISRSDALRGLPPELLAHYEQVLVLDSSVDEALPEADVAIDDQHAAQDVSGLTQVGDDVRGLHAKLYVADDGWDARLWTGSANATSAAFRHNVEFLVELRGKKSQIGIDALIGSSSVPTDLRKLLQPYMETETTEDDVWQEKFDREALKVRLYVAQAGIKANATATGEEKIYEVVLTAATHNVPNGAAVSCWPITCSEELFEQPAIFGTGGPIATYKRLSVEALTPFLAFCARIAVAGRTGEIRFVVKVPLTGAPADRKDHLLQYVIRNQRELMAYLLMLLARPEEGGINANLLQRFARGETAAIQSWFDTPIFESLLRCLDRSPQQLDEVWALLKDLDATEEGRALIPDGLSEIWGPIWTACQSMRTSDEKRPG